MCSSADVDVDMVADDLSLTAAGNSVSAINTKLQTSLQEASDWCSSSMMLPNAEKTTTTESKVITTRQRHQRGLPPLHLLLNSQVIEQVLELASPPWSHFFLLRATLIPISPDVIPCG